MASTIGSSGPASSIRSAEGGAATASRWRGDPTITSAPATAARAAGPNTSPPTTPTTRTSAISGPPRPEARRVLGRVDVAAPGRVGAGDGRPDEEERGGRESGPPHRRGHLPDGGVHD